MTYLIEGWADYNGGGAGRDGAVKITGKSYTNGVPRTTMTVNIS
jgi:hypothetical protein